VVVVVEGRRLECWGLRRDGYEERAKGQRSTMEM